MAPRIELLLRRVVPILVVALLAAGCGALDRRPAVPEHLTGAAEIPGIPGARYVMGDEKGMESFIDAVLLARDREKEHLRSLGHRGPRPPVSYLAVSGGGDNGAFGAGLLLGWTDAGTRPEFRVVTGVSTGALIAPFAYLGSEYDPSLKAVYTEVGPRDIYRARSTLLALLSGEAFSDSAPLLKLIETHVTEELLERIAAEWKKGRWLLVGTANLDARRGVIWNLGAIAESGDPGAVELVRKVLLASAAIPGVFPPVMIEVEADGERYEEMHVDGGAVSQVFLYPGSLIKVLRDRGVVSRRAKQTAFVIRNAKLHPDWLVVQRRTFSILGRSVATLLHAQGIGDLYRLYAIVNRDGVDFNLAFIGKDFEAEHPQPFNTTYMRALFDYGYQRARGGYPWKKAPPGFEDVEEDPE